jgi:SAM-dependent methyltransferase
MALPQEYDVRVWESNHVEDFLKICSFEGKNVLEVGGSLPKNYVNGLGVKSWTCIDISRENFESDNYRIIKGNISNYNFEENSYDLVFSTNCFEHIEDLEAAFSNMYRVLKPGCYLSALFGPIWSGYQGNHLYFWDNRKNDWEIFNQNPIPEWGHLIYSKDELRNLVIDKYTEENIDVIIDQTYDSKIINRLFYEDYINIINNSPFKIHEIRNWHSPVSPDASLQKVLEKKYPGKFNFSTRSLKILLQKT